MTLPHTERGSTFKAPWIQEIQILVQDNTIQALYWYNLLLVNYTAHQFKVNVKVEDEKHIYIIPYKHSYHDLSCNGSMRCAEDKVVPVNKIMLKNLSL